MKVYDVCERCGTIHATVEIDGSDYVVQDWLSRTRKDLGLCPKWCGGKVRRITERDFRLMEQKSRLLKNEAQNHFRQAVQHESKAQWKQALEKYEKAHQICVKFDALAMAALTLAYKARVFRNKGEINQALKIIHNADTLLSRIDEDRPGLYARSEVETVWGTIYLKMPLPQDKKDAQNHFLIAISVLEELQILVETNSPFTTPSFLVNLTDQRSLLLEIYHNIGVNKVNLVELQLHDEGTSLSDVDHLANSILKHAEILQSTQNITDWKLMGAGARLKAEIAFKKNDFDEAIKWFQRSLFSYKQSSYHVNPEVLTAVETSLMYVRSLRGLEEYRKAGAPRRLPQLKKIPRPIVYLYKPFLLHVDNRAKMMPHDQAQRLYLTSALHWETADWHDRCYQYLVKTIECIDCVRTNQLVGGEFFAHRRTEFFSKKILVPIHYLIGLLLLPETGNKTGVRNPINEAFYYREKCGAIGLLDELETVDAFITNYCEHTGNQKKLENIRSFNSSTHPEGRNVLNIQALEKIRAKEINEIYEPSLRELATGQVIRAEEVQEFLPEHTLLIEYFLTDQIFAVFVIASDSVSVPIFESDSFGKKQPQIQPKDIIYRINEFLSAIGHETDSKGKPTGLPKEHDLNVVKQKAKWLYDVLLRPTEALWKNEKNAQTNRLIIVPHGILHSLPFSSLFDGNQFVAEIIPSVQSPSASVLRHLYRRRASDPIEFSYFGIAPDKGLKGDKVILSTAKQLGFEEDDWTNDRLGDPSKSIFAVRHGAVSKSVWLKNISRYACIDLETHGQNIDDNSLEHSFLVSGNSTDSSKDNWISTRDIFMNQQIRMNAELLVAAMCYSGQTKAFKGDELSGLIRAFLFSGCRSILVYPWALNDLVASEFAKVFYRHLVALDGENTARLVKPKDLALQTAQNHIIAEGRQQGAYCRGLNEENWEIVQVSWEHPYYWAWILIGDHI